MNRWIDGLSTATPPPFPVQPYVSHHPPYERDSSFVGMRIRVPLAPAFLVASDAGIRPCPPPPPVFIIPKLAPWVATAVAWPVPAPVARGPYGPPNHCY